MTLYVNFFAPGWSVGSGGRPDSAELLTTASILQGRGAMKILRVVSISAMLLGCSADSRDASQPRFDATSSSPGSANGSASGAPMRGFVASAFSQGAVVIGTDFTEIQKLSSLPPGEYIVNASAVLASQSADLHYVDCAFTLGGNLQGNLTRGSVRGPNQFLSLPLADGFTITTPTDLALACRSDLAGAIVSQPSGLTAISLVKLSVQP